MGTGAPARADFLDAHPAAFPFCFVALWLVITSVHVLVSGWFGLQRRFPDNGEQSLERLRAQSGAIGYGALWNPCGHVSYSRCLRLETCPSGLRVSISPLFGPFSRPFVMPWRGMTVAPRRFLFWHYRRLKAEDGGAEVTIRRSAYDRLRLAAPQSGLPAFA